MDLTTYLQQIHARLKKAEAIISDKTLSALDSAGKEIVNTARQTKTYEDRTGNLSASMGYGVYSFGKEYSVGGFLGGQGEQEGRQLLADLARQYTNHRYVLLVVAGMEYAAYVERRGYVVLDAAELQADSIINKALSNITIQI